MRGEAGDPHQVELTSGTVLQSKTIIIASGAKWRELGVPGGKGKHRPVVSLSVLTVTARFLKVRTLWLWAAEIRGVEAALDLSSIARSVTVLEFMPELKADRVLQDKLQATANTTVITGVETRKIIAGAKGVESLELLIRETGETKTHNTEGVFVQIGLVPNSAFAKETVQTNRFGEIVIDARNA